MAKTNLMRFELLMDAGNGAQKAGDILIKAFAKLGNYVFIEPIIPAEISPPKRTPHSMSGVVIRLSDKEMTNIGSYSEFMLVEHEILLNRRLDDEEYHQNAIVLLDMGDARRAKDAYDAAIKRAEDAGLNVIPFDIDDASRDTMKELNGNGKNMFYLGLLTKIFNVDPADIEAFIRATFKKLPEDKLNKNIDIYKNGLQTASSIVNVSYEVAVEKHDKEQILLDGNTALSAGVIDAGIKFFAGYPITPASSIMHFLAKQFNAYGGTLHQAEDEIAAIGAVIGAYYGGVPSITATAGPGLSLKQEMLGLSMVSETPCILVNVQRGGPSTGLPTRTEQSDLMSAVFGCHGDNTKIVFSVANVEDCFYAPHVARYLTEKLRVPVIIMSDYITSVSYGVFETFTLNNLEDVNDIADSTLEKFGLSRLPDDIEMVKDNQANPGEIDKVRRVTGLNTDKDGLIVYTPRSNERSHVIRNEKIHHVRRALTEPEMFGDVDGADLLIVGWGSARGVIKESVERSKAEGHSVAGMAIRFVSPLPLMLKDIFAKFKRVVTVEVAYGHENKPAPLAYCLRAETLTDVESAIAHPTGRPLKPVDVMNMIQENAHV